MSKRLKRNVPEVAVVHFTDKDVVRHPVVKKVVEAYDLYSD